MSRKASFISPKAREGYRDERFRSFSERCRQKGLAVTPQRIAVIEALLASDKHPSAEEVYLEVRKKQPQISLATVHRTLEVLCEAGEARKVTPLHQSARYDGNVEPHHHLVCLGCHTVVDIEVPEFDEVLANRRTIGDYKLLGCSVEIHVVCNKCQHRKGWSS